MRCIRRHLGVALLGLAGFAFGAAPERGANLIRNGGFEDGPAEWGTMGQGFAIDAAVAHSGRKSMRCVGASLDSVHGAKQVLTFDPPLRHPFRLSGWAKAAAAEVGRDFDVYLDLHYEDGTPLWGQIAHFQPGTHDWQFAEYRFDVSKPVRAIEVHVLFREAKGTVWFDDIALTLEPFEFSHVKLLPGAYGGLSLLGSASTSLPASWTATLTGPAGQTVTATGPAAPIHVAWTAADLRGWPGGRAALRLAATDTLRGQTIEQTLPVTLAAAGPARALAVWTESSMRRVLPGAVPEAIQAQPQAHIALAANEYESFQVVLLGPPSHDLRGIEIAVSDLVATVGDSRIPAAQIEWQQVGYVRLERLTRHPEYAEATPGWWPDPLLPVSTATVLAGFAQPLWFTVFAPPGTPPGSYAGALTIRVPGQEPQSVGVQATVHGFALPVQGHLKTAFALMDGFLEKVYGKPLSTVLRQSYGDFVLRHRLNPDDISRTAPPATADLLHYRDRGLNAFNVLNLVEERGDRTWVCWSPEKAYTPEFKRRLLERLDPAVAQIREHGLAEQAYIYTFDERGKEFFPIITEYFGLVKQRYPEIRTLTTAYVPQEPAAMRALNLDWNCPLTSVYRYDQAEACRAAGLQVWAYICLGPRYPYANWLADDPLIEARVIWWQAFHQKFDGFLYWGLNIWSRPGNDTPVDPAAGPLLQWSITTGAPGTTWERLHGDGELLYAGTTGPIGSIRLANIRDGLEDYEWLWLLSQAEGSLEAARRACLPVTQSLTAFSRAPAVVAAQRQAIAQRLAELGGKAR